MLAIRSIAIIAIISVVNLLFVKKSSNLEMEFTLCKL